MVFIAMKEKWKIDLLNRANRLRSIEWCSFDWHCCRLYFFVSMCVFDFTRNPANIHRLDVNFCLIDENWWHLWSIKYVFSSNGNHRQILRQCLIIRNCKYWIHFGINNWWLKSVISILQFQFNRFQSTEWMCDCEIPYKHWSINYRIVESYD